MQLSMYVASKTCQLEYSCRPIDWVYVDVLQVRLRTLDPYQTRAAWHRKSVLMLQLLFSHLSTIVNCSRIRVARYVVAFALHHMNSINTPGRFGNRGMNQPVIDLRTQRCYITAQNHGFAVDQTTLPQHWVPLMVSCYWF